MNLIDIELTIETATDYETLLYAKLQLERLVHEKGIDTSNDDSGLRE